MWRAPPSTPRKMTKCAKLNRLWHLPCAALWLYAQARTIRFSCLPDIWTLRHWDSGVLGCVTDWLTWRWRPCSRLKWREQLTEAHPRSLESLAAPLWEPQQLGRDDSLEHRVIQWVLHIFCRCFCCIACFCFRVHKQYAFLLPLVFYCASVVTHGALLTVSSCALFTELFQQDSSVIIVNRP